jgi:hypothetical protein
MHLKHLKSIFVKKYTEKWGHDGVLYILKINDFTHEEYRYLNLAKYRNIIVTKYIGNYKKYSKRLYQNDVFSEYYYFNEKVRYNSWHTRLSKILTIKFPYNLVISFKIYKYDINSIIPSIRFTWYTNYFINEIEITNYGIGVYIPEYCRCIDIEWKYIIMILFGLILLLV